MRQLDAVFEGGGVKGIAFAGAVCEFEKRGYSWNRVAGTSAGAIIAALLAAGYTGVELSELMKEFQYHRLQARQGVSLFFPILGSWIKLWIQKGFNTGDYLLNWMDKRLKEKGVHTFADLPADRLKITASDITDGRLLVLPDDAGRIGIKPQSFPVSLAVRMSASLPFYLQPVIVKNGKRPIYVVDGGLLSNFPLWIFTENKTSLYPTIGFRLSAGYEPHPNKVDNFPEYIHAMLRTMMMAHDQRYVEKEHAVHTVFIPTDGISASKFDLKPEERDQLFAAGETSAVQFLSRLPAMRRTKTS
ncbi:patatin-like phospholipase family protein [Aneurinibacillus sp. Ricciae_BoGa-3]|uniref:patatin-like phospholipase family protein n=1 Tax=Aneurinibacillus sp. Ricciae_BoGa-3 TaxID=3022697 RepID=UPI00233FF444|nr:patatin-like phospholipase family protein [Aneurinibacillus sp. Ricciae_BoGa-3]WCK53161.1 patatin-like phospholipase family protein [Aneurinibacillus sp. Ricciae_BoGa-3]